MAYDWGKELSGFQSPAFGVGMGLLQMAAERPAASPMRTGLLQTSLLGAQRQREMEEFAKRQQKVDPRRTAKDVNGVLRYMDTGEPVYPGVSKAPEVSSIERDAMAWMNATPEQRQAWEAMKAAGRGPPASTTVNVGVNKMLTPTELRSYVHPSGKPLPPGSTTADAAKMGYQVMTREDEEGAKLEGRIRWLKGRAGETAAELEKATEEWNKDRTDRQKQRRLNRAAAAHQIALGGVYNPQGEPSDVVLEKIDEPGATGRLFDEGYDWMREKLGIGGEDEELEALMKQYGTP